MSDAHDSGAPWHVLATRAEVLRLLGCAAAARRKKFNYRAVMGLDEETGDRFWASQRRGEQAIDALLVFVATAAGLLRDPSLVPPVLAALRPLRAKMRGDLSHVEEALGLLVEVCDDDALLERWAREPAEWVRHGLARGLRPERDDQRVLLRALARDPQSEVRDTARHRLARVEKVPAWWGRWPDDPAALAGEDVAAANSASIAAWIGATNASFWYLREGAGKAVEALGTMPDALAVPALAMALGGLDYLESRAPLMVALLAREGGAAALVRETAEHATRIQYRGEHLVEPFAAVPLAQRNALGTAALAALRAMPERTWRARDLAARQVIALLIGAWDEDSDRAKVEPALARRFTRMGGAYEVAHLWPATPGADDDSDDETPEKEAADAAPVGDDEDDDDEDEDEDMEGAPDAPWDEAAPWFELLPREGVEAMLARGESLLDSGYGKGHRLGRGASEQHRRDDMEWSAGLSAAVFGLWAASVLRDPEVLPAVTSTCGGIDGRFEQPYFLDALTAALAALVPLAEPTDEALDPVVAHRDAPVRYAVIAALRPERATDRAALETLAEDATSWVREAAQARLKEVAEVAWWRGHFASDPTASLDADEAQRLRPTFEALMALMTDRAVRADPGSQLARHLAALPDDLLVAFCEHQLRPADPYIDRRWRGAVALAALGRAGSVAMLLRVAERWEEKELAMELTFFSAVVRQGDAAFRRALCDALLAYLGTRRGAPWTDPEDRASTFIEWIGVCWDPARDVTPIFELLVRQVAGDEDRANDVLSRILVAAIEGSACLVAPAARALEEGFTGRWAHLHDLAHTLVRRLPWVERRALAERVLLANPDEVEWALGELLGPLFDEERDGLHRERIAALLDEPRWREAIVTSWAVRPLAMEVLRAELRAGALDAETSAGVMADIDRRFRSSALKAADGDDTADDEDEDSEGEDDGEEEEGEGGDEEETDLDDLDDLDLLALPPAPGGGEARPELPAELSGPITDEEWSVWRRVRDRALATGVTKLKLGPLALFPPGPLMAADEPLLEYALGRIRAEPSLHEQFVLVNALERHPCERALSVIDEIIRVTQGSFYDENAREARYKICAALGREPHEGEPPPRDHGDVDEFGEDDDE